MRLLWLTENYPPSRGGMAQSCDRIVDGLRRREVTIDVGHITRLDVEWSVAPQQQGALLTCPLDEDPEHGLHRLAVDVEGRHARTPYTHVVAFGGTYPILAGPVVAAWLGIPLVTLLRGNDFDTGVFSLRRRGPLLDALRASAIVSVVAHRNVERVQALLPGCVVRYVPNGIDAADWEALPSERAKARLFRDEHVEPGRRVLGLIGHLKQKKGATFLLEALRASGSAGRAHVLLVGDLEPALDGWLAADGSDLPVTRLPFLDRFELLSVLPACDVVALPSFYDGLPNVALEAAALGVPLLASDAGGLAELVDDEVGFPFPAGDRQACREALVACLQASDAELGARGAAARQRVLADYDVAREVDGYLDLLAAASASS